MRLEDCREGSLNRLSALNGVPLFVDQLAVGCKERRQGLGVVGVGRLGESVDVEPNRVFVSVRDCSGEAALTFPVVATTAATSAAATIAIVRMA